MAAFFSMAFATPATSCRNAADGLTVPSNPTPLLETRSPPPACSGGCAEEFFGHSCPPTCILPVIILGVGRGAPVCADSSGAIEQRRRSAKVERLGRPCHVDGSQRTS